MVSGFFLSVGQLGDRAFVAVLAKSFTMTVALFAVLGVGIWYGTAALGSQWLGGYADALSGLFALFATLLALWLSFRAVAIGVVGVFADEVVAAVEARHYPAALASARPVRVAQSAAMGLRSAARVVLVNLVMVPVYLSLLVTGVGTAVAFFLVNGWLLGRDLGDMVAARHLDPAAMRDWRKATAGRRLALGLAITALFVVPVLNLLAPLLGAAMATHLFHGRR